MSTVSEATVEGEVSKDETGRLNESAPTPYAFNFAVLAAYHVLLRLGWIFKTESIVMPAVLDAIGGTAATRGALPMLSRLAMAIPPVLAADWIARRRQKKRALLGLTLCMGCTFLVVAFGFTRTLPTPLRIALFLASYTLFFLFAGLSQICFGTLQGKLIPTMARGRLMLVANVVGATVAIAAALLLLPRWLTTEGGHFAAIFTFTGVSFCCAALVTAVAKEASDPVIDCNPSRGPAAFADLWQLLVHDRALRTTAAVSTLGGCSILIFPHYQALGRTWLNLDFRSLLTWVVIQNIGTALFSVAAGAVADRHGNRIVLKTILGGLMLVPIGALVIASRGQSAWFPAVFFCIGMMPVFIRVVQNYTLEIGPVEKHAQYLATVKLCSALPFLFSALVGAAVGRLGFEIVFVGASLLVACGWGLSFRLSEPRHSLLPLRGSTIGSPS